MQCPRWCQMVEGEDAPWFDELFAQAPHQCAPPTTKEVLLHEKQDACSMRLVYILEGERVGRGKGMNVWGISRPYNSTEPFA